MNSDHLWGKHTGVKVVPPKPIVDVFTLRDRGVPIEALTTECIECVYDSLPPQEQFTIDCLIDQLERKSKQGYGSRIGRVGALELLVKIGILMVYRMPLEGTIK